MRYEKIVAGLVMAMAFAVKSSAAYDAYVTIKGQRQGEIKGESTQKGLEGSFHLLSVQNDLIGPMDNSSGMPTGKRQHKPIILEFELTPAVAKLDSALATHERLTNVNIRVFKAGPSGRAEPSFEINLTNALVVGISRKSENASGAKANPKSSISITYQKIEWTYNSNGQRKTLADDWTSAG